MPSLLTATDSPNSAPNYCDALLVKEARLAASIYRFLPGALLASSDICMVGAAGMLGFCIVDRLTPSLSASLYTPLWPAGFLFIAFFSVAQLYSVAINPVAELRRLTWCTTLAFLALAASIFLLDLGGIYSRKLLFAAWFLSLFSVPVGRAIVRHYTSHRTWWGQAAFIAGTNEVSEMVLRELRRRPRLGLKPVALVEDGPLKPGHFHGLPVIDDLKRAAKLAQELNVRYCIVATPDIARLDLLEWYHNTFRHCLVVPHEFAPSTLSTQCRDLGGIFCLDTQQPLLMPLPRLVKRCIDILLTVAGSIPVFPFILLCAMLIKLDSRGPVFYAHTRIGRNGRHFKAWKFRSMYPDANERFEACLNASPSLRKEWQENHKLKEDPRVTRIGRILRKTSLDELPQLWNVIKGEMSLVGPRPIVDAEIPKYGASFNLLKMAMPGMTGFWQVSGRTETTYEQRVRLDSFYIHNCSIWLDIYILARTVPVVLFGRGAY